MRGQQASHRYVLARRKWSWVSSTLAQFGARPRKWNEKASSVVKRSKMHRLGSDAASTC